jgi:RsiW-degrading membrane proteinase PrsW (M82 family)
MKSFKITKKQSKAEKKTSLLFWFVFTAVTVIVVVIMFYYHQNAIRAIDAEASSKITVNLDTLR